MGGQIRRGWIWRFWGAPIFRPEVPKPFKNWYLGTSGLKSGAPQKRQILPRRIWPPICGPLNGTALSSFIFFEISVRILLDTRMGKSWQTFDLLNHTLWHEIITKIIPWELFFVISEGFCALRMSRKERHFQGITREIRNFPKIILSE